MNSELRARLELLNADLAVGRLDAADAVWIACDLLVAGVETPAVIELAGESVRDLLVIDAEPLAGMVLGELGFTLLTEAQGCWWHARVLARQMLDGTLEWAHGNERLLSLFLAHDQYGELEEPDLVREYEWDYGGLDDETLVARTRAFAEKVVLEAEARLS